MMLHSYTEAIDYLQWLLHDVIHKGGDVSTDLGCRVIKDIVNDIGFQPFPEPFH